MPFNYSIVYEIVSRIPRGKVTTYGHIAAAIGLKSGARLIGYALNSLKDGDDIGIPAHRVVNRLGELTGKMHFETPYAMREKLESEGITFIGDAVDLQKHLWKPEILVF
jgi:alkylated DNA nucleotide flippase Atl1